MLHAEPTLEPADHVVLSKIQEQRQQLRLYTQFNPRRWLGSLRKATLARAIRGSNSIEGYDASLDEAMAAVEEEPPLDERTETWLAINGYRSALTYILQAASDPHFAFGKQFLKSLHFMMIHYDMKKSPGQWRSKEIFVVDERAAEVVYEAPDHIDVDRLVDELVLYIEQASTTSIFVRAAMAHLNLTMIHPFADGNGRMARALQTLVLSQDGLVHPIFSSIEEWLGRNTPEYYAVLQRMSDGSWSPEYDTLEWVRFCLTAHYQQALTITRRHEEYEALFGTVDTIVSREGLHERTAIPLFDSALGIRLTNSRYQRDAEVTVHIATRDLRTLSEKGLIVPHGERRGRYYTAGDELKKAREQTRIRRPLPDPYASPVVEPSSSDDEPRLPGV